MLEVVILLLAIIVLGAAFVGVLSVLAIVAIFVIIVNIFAWLIRKIHEKNAYKDYEKRTDEDDTEPAKVSEEVKAFKEVGTNTKPTIELPKKEDAQNTISDSQALDYARMCNAYLEHQEEMEQYEK